MVPTGVEASANTVVAPAVEAWERANTAEAPPVCGGNPVLSRLFAADYYFEQPDCHYRIDPKDYYS